MAEQIELRFPSSPVDPDTAELLELIHGDPLHDRDRAEIVEAILAEAAEHDGVVDPNGVRSRLGDHVFPRLVGAVYNSLARRGVLTVDGWTVSTDRRGRNAGRPCRRYRLRASTQKVGAHELVSRTVGALGGTDA